MPAEPIRTFRTSVSGFWTRRHTFLDDEGKTLGVLTVSRNKWGLVVGGEYRPEKGEVLTIRRDPGLLRGQFSIWTDTREWLGSSLRPRPSVRSIEIWTSLKPYRVVPTTGFGRGWRIVATKTGEVADVRLKPFSRNSGLHLYRKLDFELLLFAYFLGHLSPHENIWPSSLETLSHTAGKAKAGGAAKPSRV